MQLALRPYVTTGVAIVGASVLVVAPLHPPLPDVQIPAYSTTAVAPAALVSDLLADFNTATVAGGNAAQILINTAAGLPLGLSLAAQAIIDDPSVTPDVLNFLINSFLSPVPSPFIPGGSVFLQFGTEVIGPLVSLLPPQLQVLVGGALADIGAAIAEGLSYLPGDLATGALAIGGAAASLPAPILNLGLDIATIGGALGASIGGSLATGPGIAGFIGAAPAGLLAILESAIDDPSDIPGLLSFVAYSLVSPVSPAFPLPNISLFTTAVGPIIVALAQVLPPPLGVGPTDPGLILTGAGVLGEVITKLLALLPTPIPPSIPDPTLARTIEDPSITAAVAVDPLAVDADLGDVAVSVQRAISGLTAQLGALPEGVQELVRAVIANPEILPAAIVGLVNGGIDGLQAAVGGVALTGIRTLPRPVRAPLAGALNELNGGINGFQAGLTDAVSPADAKKVLAPAVAPTEETVDVAVAPKSTKRLVPLKIVADDPPEESTPASEAAEEADDADTETNVKRFPRHRPGDGRVSVRDLFNRDRGDADNAEKAPANDTAETG